MPFIKEMNQNKIDNCRITAQFSSETVGCFYGIAKTVSNCIIEECSVENCSLKIEIELGNGHTSTYLGGIIGQLSNGAGIASCCVSSLEKGNDSHCGNIFGGICATTQGDASISPRTTKTAWALYSNDNLLLEIKMYIDQNFVSR